MMIYLLLIIFLVVSILLAALYLSVRNKKSQLEKEKTNYETICAQANDAVLVIDIVNGSILQANPCLANLLQYDLEQLKQLTVYDIHPKNMLEKCSIAIADAWEQKGLVYSDIPFLISNGELLPVECSVKVANFAARPALIIYARDIRERLRLEKEIREKNEIIAQKNRDILDSIEYARQIQLSLIPSEAEFKNIFPDSFILYKPKDIVAGDFYWVTTFPPCAGELCESKFLLTADCTGHGVPGAFMSMIGVTLFNEAITEKKIIQPNLIFQEVRHGVMHALKQKEGVKSQEDGMDAALCRFSVNENGNRVMTCACANNSVIIVRKTGELSEIPADHYPVGGYGNTEKTFSLYSLELAPGDLVYTFTDGYADQFGGPKEKKFLYSRFEKLFLQIYHKPMQEQKEILHKIFEEWKGGLEHTDDVCVIGIMV